MRPKNIVLAFLFFVSVISYGQDTDSLIITITTLDNVEMQVYHPFHPQHFHKGYMTIKGKDTSGTQREFILSFYEDKSRMKKTTYDSRRGVLRYSLPFSDYNSYVQLIKKWDEHISISYEQEHDVLKTVIWH